MPEFNELSWLHPLRSFRRISDFLGRRVMIVLTVSLFIGVSIFLVELALAYGLQTFLLLIGIADRQSLNLPSWVPRDRLVPVLGFIFGVALIRGTLVWLQNYLRGVATEVYKYLQRSRVLTWTFNSPSASAGRATSFFGENIHQSGDGIRFLHVGIVQLSTGAFLGAALFHISPVMTLASALILVLFVAPVRVMNRRIRDAGIGIIKEWENTNSRLLRSIKNLLLLRIYGLSELENQKAQATLSGYLTHGLSYQRNNGALTIVPQALGITLICLLTFLGKERVNLRPGDMLSYFYLFIRFLQTMALVGQASANTLFQMPQLRLIMRWWETEAKPQEERRPARGKATAAVEPLAQPVGWSCKAASFTYPGEMKPVIDGLTLDVAPGSALAILGPSGAGKSTLLGLLLGELEPRGGAIDVILDGRPLPIAQGRDRLLPHVGYVGPESFLIEGTIRENLLYGVQGPRDDAEIRRSVELAECQFIFEQKLGLEHRLSEQGQGLSAGQKQRLSLARALLRRPKALILDEATANLDLATEERLVETFAQLKGKMTIVVVTHRQALLRIADHVLRLGE